MTRRPGRTAHAWRLVVLATATATMAALTPALLATPASADPVGGPSAAQVAASKAAVATREKQVAAAANAVASQQDAVQAAATAAEVAVEKYDEAQVRLSQARHAADSAQLVLDAAAARVATARAEVGRFAAAAYMSGGGLSQLQAVLTSDGPSGMLYRVGTLDAISRSQRDAMQELAAAQVYQQIVRRQTATVLTTARTAATAADQARADAQHAVEGQVGALRALQQRQHELATLLATARAHASALEKARLEAIARAAAAAREAAARRAAARAAAARAAARAAAQRAAAAAAAARRHHPSSSPPPPPAAGGGGGGGSASGTVSAATESRALQWAASQLGKPYEWGASGPDTYDCSGLVMWSYSHVGVQLDHWTGDQWNEGAHISSADIRPGDLLFFATDTSDPNTIHHVGMYAGNDEMIEAPYTGANVRYSNAWRSDLIGIVRPYA